MISGVMSFRLHRGPVGETKLEMHVGAAIGKQAFCEMQECLCSRACMHDK